MGLDQDFYKLKKDKIDYELKPREILNYYDGFYITKYKMVDFDKPKTEHIVDFRKNYDLSEAIKKVCGKTGEVDYIVISKEDLSEINGIIWKHYLKYYKNEKESDIDKCMKYCYTSKILNTIINLFDFDNYYLLYDECG